MCGNSDVSITVGGGGCGSSSETITIRKNQSCGLGDTGYTLTRTTGAGCGAETKSVPLNSRDGQTIIDYINQQRENEIKSLRRR